MEENLHPFLRTKISPKISKDELLSLLSDFRARGIRTKWTNNNDQQRVVPTPKLPGNKDDWENLSDDGQPQADCLDPFNLQRLCVLFSSNCPNSPNAPYFCVSPW